MHSETYPWLKQTLKLFWGNLQRKSALPPNKEFNEIRWGSEIRGEFVESMTERGTQEEEMV
jgi:hypothetical protein